jgi:hypothetical protein
MKVLHCTLFERHVLRFALTVFVVAVLILVVIVKICFESQMLQNNTITRSNGQCTDVLALTLT